MERKGVYTQVLEYNFPKERQSMISTTGYNVENSLGRGENFHDITHTTVFG